MAKPATLQPPPLRQTPPESARPRRPRRSREGPAAQPEPQRREAVYPATDGLIFTATFPHTHAADYVFNGLRAHFSRRRDVFVAMEMGLYYREGNPKRTLSPDVCAAFGVRRHPRDSYKVWEVGKPPDFVLEVSSRSTFWKDRLEKLALYAAIGVPEYWLFAPEPRRRLPQLQGYRLRRGHYAEIRPQRLRGTAWEYPSAVLGLGLRVADGLPRLRDPVTGKDLLGHVESERGREAEAKARRAAQAERDAEAKARRAAEAERAAARAERDAEAKVRRAAEAERDAEAHARRELEAELAALKAHRE